jgi:hypothetical protein
MVTIGIDPGVTGALALLDMSGPAPRLLDVRDMPVSMTTKSNGRVQRRVDPAALILALRDMLKGRKRGAVSAFVEHVHASPGMGVVSAFTFGHTAGTIEAALAACGVTMHLCSPSKWKPALGVPADKAASMAKATALLGDEAAQHWPRKMDHNRAEAACIALYGARASSFADKG